MSSGATQWRQAHRAGQAELSGEGLETAVLSAELVNPGELLLPAGHRIHPGQLAVPPALGRAGQ